DMGGMVKAIEFGFPQKEIADSAYWYQKAVERKEKIIVGVNAFEMDHEPIPTLKIEDTVAKQQLARLKKIKKTRNNSEVKTKLLDLKRAAKDDQNLMPFLLSCVKAYATLGEIMDALKEIYGEYKEPITY
ncbi:methylmalonyl-CoA mutase, partial [bacterium]|nr:methylmalonyl-CoA mutase [bacterium]